MSAENNWDESQADPRIKWALKVLDSEGAEFTPFYRHYGVPVAGGVFGGGCWAVSNISRRRPFYAGIQGFIGFIIFGALGVTAARDFLKFKTAEKQAAYKHYIMTHPELFPEPERKQFKDAAVFLHWDPRRR